MKDVLMTWVPDRKRWMKKYRGKMYSVSCRQLMAPETERGSLKAANLWWIRKQAEIEGGLASEVQDDNGRWLAQQLVGIAGSREAAKNLIDAI